MVRHAVKPSTAVLLTGSDNGGGGTTAPQNHLVSIGKPKRYQHCRFIASIAVSGDLPDAITKQKEAKLANLASRDSHGRSSASITFSSAGSGTVHAAGEFSDLHRHGMTQDLPHLRHAIT